MLKWDGFGGCTKGYKNEHQPRAEGCVLLYKQEMVSRLIMANNPYLDPVSCHCSPTSLRAIAMGNIEHFSVRNSFDLYYNVFLREVLCAEGGRITRSFGALELISTRENNAVSPRFKIV